jgi:hypothetical protein
MSTGIAERPCVPHRSGAPPIPAATVYEREVHADPGSGDDHRSAVRGTSPAAPPPRPIEAEIRGEQRRRDRKKIDVAEIAAI